jgi:hypothetical protein
MYEPLLERIRVLEKANRRWKLACLALALMLAGSVATGATFTTILTLRIEADQEQMDRALAEARDQEERARMMAEQTLEQQARERAQRVEEPQ